jgi:hypothetical protein
VWRPGWAERLAPQSKEGVEGPAFSPVGAEGVRCSCGADRAGLAQWLCAGACAQLGLPTSVWSVSIPGTKAPISGSTRCPVVHPSCWAARNTRARRQEASTRTHATSANPCPGKALGTRSRRSIATWFHPGSSRRGTVEQLGERRALAALFLSSSTRRAPSVQVTPISTETYLPIASRRKTTTGRGHRSWC